MAKNINSTLVTYVNFFSQHGGPSTHKNVLNEIISDITLEDSQKKRRCITPNQVKQALAFPYSNFKSVIMTKADYFSKLNALNREEKACVKMIKHFEASKKELMLMEIQGNEEEKERIIQQEKRLEKQQQLLKQQVEKIYAFKNKMNEWQNEFDQKMEEHRQNWLTLREKLSEGTVKALEKAIKIKLSESEAKQLYEIESLKSIYKRYEELRVKPPIPYKKAAKDTKSLILLKAYLVGREAKNRERIH